jgi:SsrA-binding protein
MKIVANNRKAGFNYEFIDTKEAGLVLKGWEVKSIKAGNASIAQAYALIKSEEVFLRGANISDWPGMSDQQKQLAGRDIKVLLKKEEIQRWQAKLQQKQATTIIPTKLIITKGIIKVELALAKGVKKYDKRAKIRQRQEKKEIARQLKQEKYF